MERSDKKEASEANHGSVFKDISGGEELGRRGYPKKNPSLVSCSVGVKRTS